MERSILSSRLVLLLVICLLTLIPHVLVGQATGSFRLFYKNMEADGFAHWSFDLDDPGFIHGDGDAFTMDLVDPIYHTFAYFRFGGGDISEYSCLQENLSFAAGPEDITVVEEEVVGPELVKYNIFSLMGFSRINTDDPQGVWGTLAESGESRTYMAPISKITCGDEQLILNNIQLEAIIPFATAAQMRDNLAALGYPGAGGWQNDLGTGLPVTGHGRADIDTDNTTPGFLAEMDNGTGQIEFDIVTLDFLIQGSVGYYNLTIDAYPATVAQNNLDLEVILGDPFIPQEFNEIALDIKLEVNQAMGGGLEGNLNNILINQIPQLPAKALPAGIVALAPVYWDISTNLQSFSMDITFDLTDYLPFGDPSKWRVCKRDSEVSDWYIYNNFHQSGNTITAVGVTSLSEWAIGSTDETLPVELSSFTANVNSDNLVFLQWTTQSETNLSGYNILRSITEDLNSASDLNQFIEASNSPVGHTYNFVEEYPLENGLYYYWLEAVELNGESTFHGPVTVLVTPEGGEIPPDIPVLPAKMKVYPNPFNPAAQIAVYVPSVQSGQCSIYNNKGELVYQYAPSSFNEGWSYLTWNGKDSSGKACGSGVYLVRVSGKDFALQSKIVLMK